MTYLCVSILVRDLPQARRDAALAAEAGADMVEYRIDLPDDTFTDEIVAELVRGSTLPCIVTCRPTWEGGRSTLSDQARFSSLRTAIHANAACIDVELAAYRRSGSDLPAGGRLVLSSHDFQGRPDRLYNLIAEMNAAPGDINKLAWTARTLRDNLEAFEILKTRQKPTIALCMGEAGLISRILAKKFGAFLTFASLDAASATASGQIPIADMKGLYRWDKIGPQTKVYGVVAQPVAHSMSPAIHNAAFDAANHDGLYLPLLVEGSYESFKAFMETFVAFDGLDLSGLSITLPHKEHALRYLQEKNADIEPLASRIGAVNTIVIEKICFDPLKKGSKHILHGLNTDYAAILDSITTKLGIRREDLRGIRVAVLGAGGTGRTAVAALAHYGASVTVYNRTLDRAQHLASEFSVAAASMDELAASSADIYLNTTSVGMHPNIDASPFGERPPRLTPDTLVFDAIYNPMTTKLLRQAEAAGAKTIGGVEMFVRQAARQFEAWTHLPAPIEIMRQVIERRLRVP